MHLLSLNESFLGIDISDIKEKAKIFSKTIECRKLMSSFNNNDCASAYKEFSNLENLDTKIRKLLSKIINRNESLSITAGILITLFGLHVSLKLIHSILSNSSFLMTIRNIFYTSDDSSMFRNGRDLAISIIFILYMLGYIIGSNQYQKESFKTESGFVYLPYKWHGFQDYIVKDSYDNEFLFKRKSYGNFEIYYDSKNRIFN